ncbi:MAG: HAD-IA family hydrolase [Candidatus ainarchaeum sp.]|nr:HAD-IA family hydrolase [Candidatus ainarchaeum sp.]
MLMPKLFVFDLDDTLIHLWIDWNGAVKREILECMEKDGLKLDPSEDIVLVSENASNTAERKKAVDGIFWKYEGACLGNGEFSIYAQASGILRELRKRGHKVAIASNNTLQLIQGALEAAGIEVDAVRGRDTVKKAKPHPDMLFSIMDELRFSRDDTIMVGDSCTDEGAGKAAEVRTIIVKPGEIDLKKVLGI